MAQSETVRRLRQRYPQYSDLSDQEMARRVVAKYPQYRDLLSGVATQTVSVPPAAPPTRREAIKQTITTALKETMGIAKSPAGALLPILPILRLASLTGDLPEAALAPEGYRKAFERWGLPERGSFGPAAVAAGLTRAVFDPLVAISALKGAKPALRVLRHGGRIPVPTQPAAAPTVVERITQAMQAAAPVRAETEALYAAERGRRIGKALAVGKKEPTAAGYLRQRGVLKGELPRAKFEPIADLFTQSEKDSLFAAIEHSLSVIGANKFTAKSGLFKILSPTGGGVPQPGELNMLARVFGPEFAEAAERAGTSRAFLSRIGRGAKTVTEVARAFLASFDLSGPRQGAMAMASYPKEGFRAFAQMFRFAGSENAYKALAAEITSRPSFALMDRARLAITGLGEFGVAGAEEVFIGARAAAKVPGIGRIVRASDRAYTGLLVKLRADVFDRLVNDARHMGFRPEKNDRLLLSIGELVNTLTGRGNLGRLQPLLGDLSSTLFAPRYLASRLQFLNPGFYVRMHPIVRKQALRSVLAYVSAGMATLGLAKLAGVPVGDDNRSADFGKIVVGNTRFDIWSGWQQIVVLLSRLGAGEITTQRGEVQKLGEFGAPSAFGLISRFFENKTAPAVSLGITLLNRETPIGAPVQTPTAVGSEVLQRFVPLILQDLYDILTTEGVKAAPKILPGIFGVGVQTPQPRTTKEDIQVLTR